MPKKWHQRGCGEETYTKKCYRCGGNGRRAGKKEDPRDCAYCNGFGVLCGACDKPFVK